MALPHLPTSYTTRKNIYEAAIVRQRNHDTGYREVWENNAKYFHRYGVETNKQKHWQSNRCFQNSMDAYSSQQKQELKQEKLKARRKKLAEMLSKERDQFQAELKGLSPDNYARLEDMKERSETLRSAREEKRKALAEDLLYEQWKRNNPDIRKMEKDMHSEHVVHSWGDQVEERQAQIQAEQQAKLEYEESAELERQAALELQRKKEQKKIEEEKELKNILRTQIQELKAREAEADKLKIQQEMLMKQQWELEKLEEQRKVLETERKNRAHGRVLLRQHAAALKRKSRQVMEELEQDKQFLEMLIKQEATDQEVQTARREKARADASWMKQVIEEQLRLEKTRDAELDQLYQDEAARVWQEREAAWARERQARERLMQEVLNARQEQVQQRMLEVEQQQQESIERREELLRDMEIAQQLTQREEKQKEQAKQQMREELAAQMSERLDQEERQRRTARLQEEEEKAAERDYEEMLRQEAERMNVQGYQPKAHGRRQAWM